MAFTAPGILFFGTVDLRERQFAQSILRPLRERGYNRFIETCCGAFGMSLAARSVGYVPADIDSSDVGLYSSVVGYLFAGKDLAELDVRLDDVPVELPGDRFDAAATLLWTQLLARLEAKPEVEYWQDLVGDINFRRDAHLREIRRDLESQHAVLSGIGYRPLDVFKHLDEVLSDEHAVISANPPAYKEGFEKFYDTKGRLTWAEPDYSIFDPATGVDQLRDYVADAPALVLYLHQAAPGEARHPKPIYARHLRPGYYWYYCANRPDEIFELTGGPRVVPRDLKDVGPLDVDVLPSDYDLGNASEIRLVSITKEQASYYKQRWLHRIAGGDGNSNFGVLVDGYLFGVGGVSFEPMQAPWPAQKWVDAPILKFALGAPHERFRTGRLLTRLCISQRTLMFVATPGTTLHAAAANRIVTIEYTRHPEAKSLRGLMKLVHREPNKPDGWKLVYGADLTDEGPEEALATWLELERKYAKVKGAA